MQNPFKKIFEKRNAPPKDVDLIQKISYGNANLYPVGIENPTASSAISLISNTIAKLSCELYFKKNDNSRIKAGFHPLYNVLKRSPNPDETIFTFKSRLVRYLLQNGNAYIFKDGLELYFLNPAHVTVKRNAVGKKIFIYGNITYTSEQVLHIPALIYDGLIGHSPLESAKWAVELGNTLDSFSKNSITNGLNTQVLIDASEYLTGIEDKTEISAELNQIGTYYKNHGAGSDNAGKPLVLIPQTKATVTSLSSNRDAELQASRDFQAKEISKIFNLPLALLQNDGTGDLENSNQQLLSYCISPWLRHIEQYLNLLLTPFEQERYYFEFSTDAILLTSTATKWSAYETAIRSGILSINEVRARENLPALDEVIAGDTHFYGANLLPLKDDNLNAYFAQSKLALQQITTAPAGSDKL